MWETGKLRDFQRGSLKTQWKLPVLQTRGRAIDRATALCLLGCTHSGMYKLV